MKTISFVCKFEEVAVKTAKLESVIRTMACNCWDWDMLPAVVAPINMGEEMMALVTINYDWGLKFPVPQNFEEMFGNSPEKKSLRDTYVSSMRESWGKE